jgi:hypothetical protein
MPMPRDLGGLQHGFAQRLLRSEPARDRRMAVYRNNVAASLVGVLRAHFPVTQRIVGEEFFEAAAVAFVRRAPPVSPVLAEYGGGFAAFLEGFAPAAELPYLPDVARLEWARIVAYNAADDAPIGIERLAAASDLGAVRLRLHPAVQVVASPWPIVSIWETNTHDAEARRIGPDADGESALVTRPALDVRVARLPPDAPSFLDAVRRGLPLAEAAADVDLASTLATLFTAGAIAGIDPEEDK